MAEKRDAEKRKLAEVANHPSQRKLMFSPPPPPHKDLSNKPPNSDIALTRNDPACETTAQDNDSSTSNLLSIPSNVTTSIVCSDEDEDEVCTSAPGQATTADFEMVQENESSSTLHSDDERVFSNADSDSDVFLNESINSTVRDKGLQAQDAVLFVAPASTASVRVKKTFVKHHPIQPSSKLPFDYHQAFFVKRGSTAVNRAWLSYYASNCSLYCTSCMLFDTRSESSFVSGFKVTGRKDIYSSIERHESSAAHKTASSACILAMADKDVGTLINEDLNALNVKEKELKRAIVGRIVDILLFIGRQGLAFRGTKEGISNIYDSATNHGKFLELAKLLAEYDPVLKDHIQHCIEVARRRKSAAGKGKKQGRGSLVTFLSKNFINKVITIIGQSIQDIALSNVKEAGIFSIEIDSTQDIAAIDQLAIVVRYVSKTGVKETLLTLTVSYDATGLGLYNQLKEILEKLGLDIKNVVACSFDGASNMSGCFKGLQARLKKDNPDLIHTHCAGHCLNLVLTSCTEACNPVKTFFGLVQSSSVFVSESHKRMDVWTKIARKRNVGSQKLKRLRKWGKTRWWSKPVAIKSIIDADGKSTTKFVDYLLCMEEIRTSTLFDSATTFSATNFRDNWCKFENVLLAFIMLAVFEFSTPVSEALQSPSIDYLVTFSLVNGLLVKLTNLRNQFDALVERTKKYVDLVNEELEKEGLDFRVNDKFTVRRNTRNLSSEASADEQQKEAASTFRVDVFNIIVDHATQGLRDRFVPNEGLLRDCSVLDPKRFKKNCHVSPDDTEALSTISSLAKVDPRQARVELDGFASSYDSLSSASAAFTEAEEDSLHDVDDISYDFADEDVDSDGADSGDEEELREPKAKCAACRRCLPCALLLFLTQPMLQCAYPALFALYKFVLTVPTTQVTCERAFSKLKIIKTRLRNLLSQDLLEPLLFMSVERELCVSLDKKNIIFKIARSSPLLENMLL